MAVRGSSVSSGLPVEGGLEKVHGKDQVLPNGDPAGAVVEIGSRVHDAFEAR
ncbi:hypothetical protein [Streptomyces sp. NPDC018972]|uniref:hypothetical protein n=1 Tax=Streptomyces sp. NPDC018972 TaxID=3365060 RepID=UPI00379352B1